MALIPRPQLVGRFRSRGCRHSQPLRPDRRSEGSGRSRRATFEVARPTRAPTVAPPPHLRDLAGSATSPAVPKTTQASSRSEQICPSDIGRGARKPGTPGYQPPVQRWVLSPPWRDHRREGMFLPSNMRGLCRPFGDHGSLELHGDRPWIDDDELSAIESADPRSPGRADRRQPGKTGPSGARTVTVMVRLEDVRQCRNVAGLGRSLRTATGLSGAWNVQEWTDTRCTTGSPSLQAGLCNDPARGHGLGQGLVVALVLVGVGTGEVGDGPVEESLLPR